jgi:phosphopantetheinyl transferase
MPSAEVRWPPSLSQDPGGTAAWLFSLSEVATRLDPTARDTQDIGPRRGAEAQRFLLRRTILRELIGRRCGVAALDVEVGYDAVGRPLVLRPAAALFCSLSGRGDHAALALSPHPVGIDIEPLQPGDIPWAAFAPDEAGELRARPEGERLAAALRLWTVKEAFLKARGSGLLHDPATTIVCGNTLRTEGVAVALHPSSVCEVTFAGTIVIGACIAIDWGEGL